MAQDKFAVTAVSGAPLLHAVLLPIGAAFLLGALVTDITYVKTVAVEWETFSVWLISGGLVIAGFTALALAFDLIGRRRSLRMSWPVFACAVVAVILSILNAFVHSRDGYTAVAPTGLILSVIVAALLLGPAINSWSLCRRFSSSQVA